MTVSTVMEEKNKTERNDALIDVDLLPRSEARCISPLSGTSKYQPYY